MTVAEFALHPLTVTKLAWVVAALLTLLGATRCWWRMRAAQRSPAGRSASMPVQVWGAALVEVAGSLAMVALLNLVAGLVALMILPPSGPVAWTSLVIPTLFIASALVKMRATWALDVGYRRVTRRSP